MSLRRGLALSLILGLRIVLFCVIAIALPLIFNRDTPKTVMTIPAGIITE